MEKEDGWIGGAEMSDFRSQPMTATADLIRELRDDFPAVDVTTVVFSRDFAGVGCCVIPQEKVLEIISRLQELDAK
jgi:hypothetical protein